MSLDWTIEKGLPIPPPMTARTGRWAGLLQAMNCMEPGDSVFIANERGGLQTAQSATTHAALAHGRQYARRAVEGGARLWRVR